jgi:protoheme IX farnesyltransferase
MADVATRVRLSDLIALTKPRITRLVVFTSAVGMWLAPAGTFEWRRALLLLVGSVLVVSGANVLNMYWERDVDGLMERTRNRPLPAGRMPPSVALFFGLGLSAVSLPLLTFGVNPITGLLAALALVSYVCLYTPLKQKSWIAVWVGAVPGAIPPLMGWTAATGRIGAPGVALFAIMFLWQVPHTLAITLFRHNDYASAGFQTLPVQRGERATRWQTAAYSPLLVVASLTPVVLGFGHTLYLVTAVVLGVVWVGIALAGLRQTAGVKWARGLFVYSIVYLTLLFGVLLATAGHVQA